MKSFFGNAASFLKGKGSKKSDYPGMKESKEEFRKLASETKDLFDRISTMASCFETISSSAAKLCEESNSWIHDGTRDTKEVFTGYVSFTRNLDVETNNHFIPSIMDKVLKPLNDYKIEVSRIEVLKSQITKSRKEYEGAKGNEAEHNLLKEKYYSICEEFISSVSHLSSMRRDTLRESFMSFDQLFQNYMEKLNERFMKFNEIHSMDILSKYDTKEDRVENPFRNLK